jgi:ATP/maltotriose-dependent transcriptional regulator MalT
VSTKQNPQNRFATGVSPTRITPPKPLPNFIVRQELLNKLDTRNSRLTIITAPTGYGKSALAAQWIARNAENGIWYSVAREHTPIDTFEHLIVAIRKIVPNFAPWAEEISPVDFDFGRAIMRMANDLATYDRSFSMVVDGSDLFTSAHATGMQNFINHASSNLRILSLRNQGSSLELSGLDNAEELTQLSAHDMGFTKEEKQAVAKLYKLDSEDPVVMRILNEADNWPAGIHILAKAIAGHGTSPLTQLDELAHSDGRLIIKYAVDNLAPEVFEILQAVSFLSEISEAEIHELTGSPIAARVIKELSDSGIYVVRNEEMPHRYRINDFIRSEVRSRLDKDPEELMRLARASAAIALRNSQIISAIEIYTYAGLKEEAATLVIDNLIYIIYSGNTRLIATWLPRLKEVRNWNEIDFTLGQIYGDLSIGNIENAKMAMMELRNSSSATYQADFDVIQAQIQFNAGRFTKAIELGASYKSLRDVTISKTDFRHFAGMRTGISAAFLSGRFEEVIFLAKEAFEGTMPEEPLVQNVLMPGGRALSHFVSGNYLDAEQYARLCIQGAERLQVGGANLPYEAAFVLADVLLEFGREDESLEVVRQFLPSAIEFKQWPWVVALLSKAALVRLQQGKISESLGLVRQAREYVNTPQFDPQITFMIDFIEVFIRLAMGDMERTFEILGRLPDNKFTHAFLVGLQAKQDPAHALKIISTLPESSEHEKFIKAIFHAELNSHNPPAATRYLEQAIEIAIPRGYFRAFVNLSDNLKNMILDLAGKMPTVYLENLAAVIRAQSMARSQTGGRQGHSLTKREMEILRRLSTGLPIVEIAKSLNISQNTIKTHLKNLYRKLNVESRAQALKVGQELLLL